MEHTSKNRAPKTRLQERAPASLHLTTHYDDNAKARGFSDACSVIPLLSPLVLPRASVPESNQQPPQCGDGKAEHVSFACQHPAAAAFTEPSAMLFASIFQSQCTLVPHPCTEAAN